MSVWEAAISGDLAAVETAVENGTDVNKCDDKGYSVFHHACAQGRVDIATYLIEKQVNVNAPTEDKDKDKDKDDLIYGRYPLHLGADAGHLGIVTLLLDNGFNVNLETIGEGSTPLHLASQSHHFAVANCLLERDAKVNSRDHFSYSPLHLACMSGDWRIVQLLLGAGADVNSISDSDGTPLVLALAKGYPKIGDYLCQHGAKLNTISNGDCSAFRSACANGYLNSVEWLLGKGYDVNARSNNGNTGLHCAVKQGIISMTRFLICDAGAELNCMDDDGNMPLHVACKRGYLNLVKLLTSKAGSDLLSTNNNGDTPLQLAQENGHTDIVTVLQDKLSKHPLITGDILRKRLSTENNPGNINKKKVRLDITTGNESDASLEDIENEEPRRKHGGNENVTAGLTSKRNTGAGEQTKTETVISKYIPETPAPLKWMKRSVTHREKFYKLTEYMQTHPDKMEEVNGVRVCFVEEFCIGLGSDGTAVYLGLGRDGCEKAVKRMLKFISGKLGSHEKMILSTPTAVYSKYVVNYWYYDEDSNKDFSYLILDLQEETLEQHVKTQGQQIVTDSASIISRQILEGLNELHRNEQPILHRDLKPSNIMRNVQGDWLLADFGISRKLPVALNTHKTKESGSLYWSAVESHKEGRYKTSSDIQVAGMVIFYILSKGGHPFGPEHARIQNLFDDHPVSLDILTDPSAKDLISWMLQSDPADRPCANEALKHPYFKKSNEQFELLENVGNLPEIKSRGYSCDIVSKLNDDPQLSTRTWKSEIRTDFLAYLCNDGERCFPYGNKWTECLRLMRNTSQHWNERARPRPKIHYDMGEPQEYFLKVFPTLPVAVHRIIRSNKDWKEREKLKKFF